MRKQIYLSNTEIKVLKEILEMVEYSNVQLDDEEASAITKIEGKLKTKNNIAILKK